MCLYSKEMLLQSWHKNILVGIQSNTVNTSIWCDWLHLTHIPLTHIRLACKIILIAFISRNKILNYYLLYSSNNIHHIRIVKQLFDVSFASQRKLLTEKEFLSPLQINPSVTVNHMVVYTVVYTVFTANDNWWFRFGSWSSVSFLSKYC